MTTTTRAGTTGQAAALSGARTCATCRSFTEEGECFNLVAFVLPDGIRKAPAADDVCNDHLTHAEEEQGGAQ